MSMEFEEGIFITPSRLFTNLEDPESREKFQGLMQLQYDFSDEEVDELTEGLRKRLYWNKVGPELLALVINEESERVFQVGTLIGYSQGEFIADFGDLCIERMGEEEILLIGKADISSQARIKVKFLDESWQDTIKEGILTGYEKNEDRESGGPHGWYVVQVGAETQKIEDWRMLEGNIRFLVEPPG